MGAEQSSGGMSIGQLGHRPGLHVNVNLEGMTVGGLLFGTEEWVPGVVIGSGGDGTFATIEFDTPIGGGARRGLFRRGSGGQSGFRSTTPPVCGRWRLRTFTRRGCRTRSPS